jgi:outer membrane immunogenic protein
MLGLGYKQMIRSGFYRFTEANYMSYGNATIAQTGSSSSTRSITNFSSTIRFNSYQFLLGLGYKF